MVQVKICGITSLEDALAALDAGADLLGFNFYTKSPRYIDPQDALLIFEQLPSNIPRVGVFVNEDMERVLSLAIELEFDYLQFHGDETSEQLNELGRPWFKALRPKSKEDLNVIAEYDCEWILIDASAAGVYGGSGELANWDLAKLAKQFGKKLILAGGLNEKNVHQAVHQVEPFMIDVASGVESSPGKKSAELMQKFIQRAKTKQLKLI